MSKLNEKNLKMSLGVTKQCFPAASLCHNCQSKFRGGLTEETRQEFQRCSQCHFMTYCDKDCQKEHWNAIHKHHCGFLSGRKLVANSKHDLSSCSWCVKARMKREAVNEAFDLNSPKSACYVQTIHTNMKDALGVYFDFHREGKTCGCSLKYGCELPFSPGEVSGEYIGRGIDELMMHTIGLACAMNMKKKGNTNTSLMVRDLIASRIVLWSRVLIMGRGEIGLPKDMLKSSMDRLQEMGEYFGFTNVWWMALNFSVHLLKDMLDVLPWEAIDVRNLEDPKFPIMKKHYQFVKLKLENISLASENKLWDNFKMWPTLVSGSLVLKLSEGVRCQNCNVELVGEVSLGHETALPRLISTIGTQGCLVAVCSSDKNPTCFLDFSTKLLNINTEEEILEDQHMEEWKLFYAKSRLCDVCRKHSFSSHRCSECLAAQYCSTRCQKKDLGFHKTVCAAWATDKGKTMKSSRQQKKDRKSELYGKD